MTDLLDIEESQKSLQFPIIQNLNHLRHEIEKIFDISFTNIDAHISELVVELSKGNYKDKASFKKAITDLCKSFKGKLKTRPRIPVLIQYYEHLLQAKKIEPNEKMRHLMKLKSVRSESGVLVITVLTSPGKFSCPKNCHYCPNEVNRQNVPIMPRSYISTEPACRRATECFFDPVLQIFSRARRLQINGHQIDKMEVLILGGTWSFYPKDYQTEFIRDIFYAANIYHEYDKTKTLRERYSLDKEQEINETAACRIIGITIETRPDYITLHEIKNLRILGVTRVQLGIQHVNDNILKFINRDCTTKKAIKAIKVLKENGFKVDIHLMPDLPGSSPEEDIKMFYNVLTSSDLQADYWKIYPCEVTPFTEIEKWYKAGTYKPYAELQNGQLLINVLIYVLSNVPRYIRVNRVIRDIPNQTTACPVGIIGGNMVTNLRQVIDDKMKQQNIVCMDIRSREVKDGERKTTFDWNSSSIFIESYESSGGQEFFISVEHSSEPNLYGLLRLRYNDPDFSGRIRDLEECALIRELHVYGNTVPVNQNSDSDVGRFSQHRGIGKKLLQVAEQLAYRDGWTKIAVIAGVGSRMYYQNQGYERIRPFSYYVKTLKHSSSQLILDEVIYRSAKSLPLPHIPNILKGQFSDISLQTLETYWIFTTKLSTMFVAMFVAMFACIIFFILK